MNLFGFKISYKRTDKIEKEIAELSLDNKFIKEQLNKISIQIEILLNNNNIKK